MPGRPLLIALAAAIAALLLGRVVEPLDRRSFDARLSLRRDRGWPADLVLVPIDDAAIRSQGRWPWPRATSARLLERVHEAGAKTILFDASLVGRTTPEDDAAMGRAIANAVIGIAWSSDAGADVPREALEPAFLPVPPPPEWIAERRKLSPPETVFAHAAAGMGHTMLQVKNDGFVRSHVPLMGVQGSNGSVPSLPLAAWMRHRELGPGDVRLENSQLVMKGSPPTRLYRGEMYLDFVPGGARPPSIRAEALLPGVSDDAKALLRGKLALVYVDSILQPDALPSPLGTKTPGGEILAAALRSFDHGAAPIPVPRLWAWALVGVVTAALSGRLSRTAPSHVLAAGALLAVLVVAAGFALVPIADRFVSIAAPAVQALLWGAFLATYASRASEQERTQLRALLEGVPRAMVPLEERSTVAVGGRATKDSHGTESLLGGGPLLQPVQIGRYLVQRPLGRGGMGAIFLAIDQDLARPVAIKILESQSKEGFERFRREALAVARIVHPNVVQIHEVGFDASVPYIVMELVAGGTLSDLLRDPDEPLPMDWVRAAAIMRGIARGLGAAHRAGIVHRDVKPSNLLLVNRTGTEAKVADFGIAKLSGGESLTREGMFIGTIGYLAPEQATGQEVDARSDVYSLGITFYRLLTGQHAFEGSTAEVLKATVRQTVPDVRTLNPGAPAALAELIARMTNLQPAERPADGNAVAEALDVLLESHARSA